MGVCGRLRADSAGRYARDERSNREGHDDHKTNGEHESGSEVRVRRVPGHDAWVALGEFGERRGVRFARDLPTEAVGKVRQDVFAPSGRHEHDVITRPKPDLSVRLRNPRQLDSNNLPGRARLVQRPITYQPLEPSVIARPAGQVRVVHRDEAHQSCHRTSMTRRSAS